MRLDYANLYDEIVQGYEDGTGQINVVDKNSEQEKITDYLAEKLISIRDGWEAAYAASGRDEAWKSIVSMFGNMFR